MSNLQTEVEKRGILSPQQKKDLLNFLVSEAEFIRENNQLTVFCETSGERLGTIDNAKARISIALLKDFARDGISAMIKAKLGKIESHARQEIEIPFEVERLQHSLEFLRLFGINSGCPRFYHRLDYQYGDFQITVKDEGLLSDHFEIETVVNHDSEIDSAINWIDEFVDSRKLNLLTEGEYRAAMLEIYQNNPPVPFEDIDFEENLVL